MAEGEQKNWRELCNAARKANDPDELLKILQELNKALKREGQVRGDFRSRIPGASSIATRWGISATLRRSTFPPNGNMFVKLNDGLCLPLRKANRAPLRNLLKTVI
jgi:hypothetical protein